MIKGLKDTGGALRSGRASIEALVVDYFEHLFATSSPDVNEQYLCNLGGRVSFEDGEMLVRPFTKAELENALKQMAPTKAPKPDGMTALFFQRYWRMVGNAVCRVILNVLNGGPMPNKLNHIVISLIPKVKKPESMKET